jgi:hypothetical protein
MDTTRRYGRLRITAVIAIDGPEDGVLEDGSRLLQLVADGLDRSRLVSLRLEHDGPGGLGQVAQRGTDALDLVTTGADSPEEATLWRLVLRASAKADSHSTGIADLATS